MAMDSENLKEQIQNQCGSDFKKVIDGEKTSFICLIKTKQSHRGADYEFRTRFKVIKTEDTLKITNITGRLANGEKHLSEASFCNDCFQDREFQDSSATDFMEFMKEVSNLAEDISIETEQEIEEAFENYNKKDRERTIAKLKEKNCEGFWNTETNDFQDFEETTEIIECRLSQMNREGNLKEVEEFYHSKLKKELWRLYEEGEEDLLEETLKDFNNPYRYSLSVRASVALLDNYTRWKEGFDVLESLRDKEEYLLNLSRNVEYFTNLMTEEQSEQDLYYINRGFDGLYKTVNDTDLQIEKARSTAPLNPGIDYDAISEEVKGLY